MRKLIAAFLAMALIMPLGGIGMPQSYADSPDGSVPKQHDPVGPGYEMSAHPLKETTLTLIHDTHFHGNFGDTAAAENIANYFGVARQIRTKFPNSLYIANGDDTATSVLSNNFQGKHMIDALNAAKVSVDTFGNHDFDMGPAQLAENVKASSFPWVSANVIDKRTNDVFAKEQGAKKFVIREVNGVKVGLTGLLAEDAPELTSMGENVTVIPAVEAMKAVIPEMKAAGADIVVVASHLASPDARKVAEQVQGIDVIVGDHAAYAYETPEKIGSTLLWFIGDEFEFMGQINLEIKDGKIADFNFHRYTIADEVKKEGFQPDPDVKAVMDDYHAKLSKELGVVIGKTSTELDVMKASQRSGETAIGNFVADSVRDYTGADLALVNGGGIRADRNFPIGDLTKKDIIDALPFTNYVVKLEVSGDTIRQALENGVSQIETGAGRFPQVSGMSFTFNPKMAPGSRVVDIQVGGKPLDPSAKYTLATLDFVANGGDGYGMFKGAKVLLDANAGPLLNALIIDTIQKQGTIAPRKEGRIETTGSVPESAKKRMKLRLMETSDIHVEIMNYDYFQDKPTDEFGLVRTATLIRKARDEAKNSLLFDNGDLIQGNPMGDYIARVDGLKDKDDVHPVYKAMDLLDYDAGNIGNHEFNYGLDFLKRSLQGANFPYVNANIYVDDHDKNPDNDRNYFTPYLLLDRTFKNEAGEDVKLKVGVIGFVPPQVMQWDRTNLEGKVIAKDIVETAEKFVPKMIGEGADLIIAIPHSGMGGFVREGNEENAAYLLSKVKGINAILFGHSHVVFPGPTFKSENGIDAVKGTINGIPAVEPGYWGNNLGVIDLTLERKDGKWTVADSLSEARPISEKKDGKTVPLVETDQQIADAVKEDHEATLKYIRGPVGKTAAPITSYFALVQDDPSVQIVTNAQKWYVEKHIQGTELEGIPVLSAGAPFKAGGRMGPEYYTHIPTGTIAIKNVSDLYVYPNTLKAVLLNGEQVREWLERSAGQFNRIDPNGSGDQPLVDSSFPTYNFDVIDGVTYKIDVTQPSRYDKDGKLASPSAHRITDLRYQGKPVTKDMKFLVATNNYRAGGGGGFPGLDGSNIVIDSPDETRQVIIDYIAAQKTINPSADGNWSFAPIKGKAKVTFETSPAAKVFAKGIAAVKWLSDEASGFAKYSLDMSKPPVPAAVPLPGAGKPSGSGGKGDSTTGGGKGGASDGKGSGGSSGSNGASAGKGSTGSGKATVYIVKKGDWLSKIARKYGLDWRDLADYNHLKNPDLIYPGDKILIPGK